MGLWESARHSRTITVTATIITVMGTTLRLAAPMAPTERGALDHMGARSSADPISCNNNCGAAASREPEKGFSVVAVRISDLIDAGSAKPESSSRSASARLHGRYGALALEESSTWFPASPALTIEESGEALEWESTAGPSIFLLVEWLKTLPGIAASAKFFAIPTVMLHISGCQMLA